jgi:ferritin-like metal-binding protein YciE
MLLVYKRNMKLSFHSRFMGFGYHAGITGKQYSMKIQSHEDLFFANLKDLYDVEKQLTKALPKLVKAAANSELREALQNHLKETEGHVKRLEKIFTELDLPVRGKKSAAMAAILDAGKELVDAASEDDVRDAAIVFGSQHVEHYEIAGYMAAIVHAELLGFPKVSEMLGETLEEEDAAREKLDEFADTMEMAEDEEVPEETE